MSIAKSRPHPRRTCRAEPARATRHRAGHPTTHWQASVKLTQHGSSSNGVTGLRVGYFENSTLETATPLPVTGQ